MEIFKTIEEYPMYVISDKGRVFNKNTRRYLKPSRKPNGYMQVNLCTRDGRRKKEYIHRLVAIEFIPNPLHLPQVNHIDGKRDNNVLSNLEWVTPLENVRKGAACQPVKVFKTNLEFVGTFPSIQDACDKLGLTGSNISCCLNGGKQKSHKGYVFEKMTDQEV